MLARTALPVGLGRSWSRSSATPIVCRRTTSNRQKLKEKLAPPTQPSSPSTGPPRPKPKAKQGSAFSDFVRRTPVLNKFADGTLILGDIVMVAATEVSSERIPFDDLPLCIGVMVATWVGAAATLGDYKGGPPTHDNWYVASLGPVFIMIIDSMLTWALAATLAIAIFSALVSTNMLESTVMLEDLGTENLSPQLEVAVATLITMSCWRGIAARLRY